MAKLYSRRSFIGMSLASAAGLAIAGCSSNTSTSTDSSSSTEKKGTIIVGSKQFTEEYLLAEMYSLALENAGYEVTRMFQMSTDTLVPAMQKGEVDIYPEYIGTCLTDILEQELETDKDKVYETDNKLLKEKYNLQFLDMSNVQDKLCLAMKKEKAEELGITNLTELRQKAGELVLGSIGNFSEREDDLLRMNKFYGEYTFKDTKEINYTQAYSLLDDGTIDVTCANTTDAALATGNYTALEEDITIWPPQYAAPLCRIETIEKYPDIEEALNKVSKKLTTDKMIELNGRVDTDKEEYEDVAKDFFDENCK